MFGWLSPPNPSNISHYPRLILDNCTYCLADVFRWRDNDKYILIKASKCVLRVLLLLDKYLHGNYSVKRKETFLRSIGRNPSHSNDKDNILSLGIYIWHQTNWKSVVSIQDGAWLKWLFHERSVKSFLYRNIWYLLHAFLKFNVICSGTSYHP